MIWIPIFSVVTLLFFRRYRIKRLETSRNLVGGTLEDVHATLNEVCELKTGHRMTGVKILVWVIVCLVIGLPVVLVIYFGFGLPDWFSLAEGAEIGIGVGVAFNLLPMVGINPLRRGSILVDRDTLRLPRLARVEEFDRTKTNVWIHRAGVDMNSCLVRENAKCACFFVNDESADVLKLWAMLSVEEGAFEELA
jgi:hypothetical protein